MDFKLTTPITKLSGVGSKLQPKLKKLGLASAQDLLFYFPFRYEDYRNLVSIGELPDRDGEFLTVQAKLQMIKTRRGWKSKKNITEAVFADEEDNLLRVVWFNQPYLTKVLHPGDLVNLSGKIKVDMLGPQLVAPTYEKTPSQPPSKGEIENTHTARLVPVYPLTEGITQKQIRFLIKQVIELADSLEEWIPDEILEKYDLVDLSAAVKGIHFPADDINLEESIKRLKFGELFTLQLKGEFARTQREKTEAPKINFQELEIKKFVQSLPFKLTDAQRRASWDILQDLEKRNPMNRLLSGDVGSGKTVVAAMALYNTALNKQQSVFLAPTEILASQHFESLKGLFRDLNINVGLYTRNQACSLKSYDLRLKSSSKISNAKIRKNFLQNIEQGEVDIIVGTHAVLSEKINFKNLGLVIVDEQHRFGVRQRQSLKDKVSPPPPQPSPQGTLSVPQAGEEGRGVHFLSMTATPIPRSLALMLYGDLDLSQIDEYPQGRKKIITRLVEKEKRGEAYKFIKTKVKEGRQVFVICPLVSENLENRSENLGDLRYDKKSVESEYQKLSTEIFPDLKIGYLYGKLKAGDKEQTMKDFKSKKIDILVSTSVVEVGVDVPNAAIMMIEGAENFGLAQLHQFRGRVGRGEHQSYCFLFTETDNEDSLGRLRYFEQLDNGFKLAEKDLETRGPGEVYGTKQSGGVRLKLARLSDKDLIKKARNSARELVKNIEQYPKIKKKFNNSLKTVHLE